MAWRLPDGVANERDLTKHTRKSQKQKKTQAEKSSHTMRVANADSDWDIPVSYTHLTLPTTPYV